MKFCLIPVVITLAVIIHPPGLIAADNDDTSDLLSWLAQYISKKATTTTKSPLPHPAEAVVNSDIYKPLPMNGGMLCGLTKYSDGDALLPQPLAPYNGAARSNESPWLARIVDASNYRWFCDGTILSNRAVLAAASCLDNTRKYIIVAGDHIFGQMDQGETSVSVAKVIIHPSYDKSTKRNDFAILLTSIPIQMDRTIIRPVCLPTAGVVSDFAGSYLNAVGWANRGGPMRTTVLQKESGTNLIKTFAECRRLYEQHESVYHVITSESDIICVANSTGDSCIVDLGGPLTEFKNGRHFLVGVASTVPNCSNKSKLPAVFGRVAPVVPWILAQISASPVVTSIAPPPIVTRPPFFPSGMPTLPPLPTRPPLPSSTNDPNHDVYSLSSSDCGVSKYMNVKAKLRIVGGAEAKESQIPWQVRLLIRGFLCGGTIIHKRAILTAAHCIATKNLSHYRVVAGDHSSAVVDSGEQVVEIAKVIVHEGYNDDTNRNDFALLITAKDISFASWSTRPVCLPTQKSENYAGWNGTISGWGRVAVTSTNNSELPSKLQVATVTVQAQAKCAEAYRSRGWLDPGVQITDEMICASAPKQDTCQGDSGGPMTVLENGRHILIGVTSFGKACGSDQYPGVYARVTSILDWLERTLLKHNVIKK